MFENSEEFKEISANIESYHGHIDVDRSIKNDKIDYAIIREVNLSKTVNDYHDKELI
jgi:hypothetical protein